MRLRALSPTSVFGVSPASGRGFPVLDHLLETRRDLLRRNPIFSFLFFSFQKRFLWDENVPNEGPIFREF